MAFRGDFPIDILALRRDGPEYPFWLLILGFVNQTWREIYEGRTGGHGVAVPFISWDFIDGVDAETNDRGYRQALEVITNIVRNSSSLTSMHFDRLIDGAEQVLAGRLRVQEKYGGPGNDIAHDEIIELWDDLVKAIRSRRAS